MYRGRREEEKKRRRGRRSRERVRANGDKGEREGLKRPKKK
jgi:hypothetical protein